VATIGLRAFIDVDPLNRDQGRLDVILNAFQMIALVSSLVTNILGTGVISLKAWYALRLGFWLVTTLLSLP
jgi:hypothetical protein